MNSETTYSYQERAAVSSLPALRPAGWGLSLALFGVPAALVLLSFYGFRPWLEQRGYSEITSFLAAVCVPTALLFAAALIAYHRVEGRPLTREAFAQRMRYPRLGLRDVLWGLALFAVGMLGYGLMSQVSLYLVQHGLLPLPAHLPVMADPRAFFSIDMLNQAAGGQIKGQWQIAVLYLVTYFFNIAGEELWWRGYIFPRQLLVFGRYTWLVHGLLWTAFHVFKYWDMIGLLPICLLIAYAAGRFKNNWPSLIAHALFNFGGMLPVILAIFGAIN